LIKDSKGSQKCNSILTVPSPIKKPSAWVLLVVDQTSQTRLKSRSRLTREVPPRPQHVSCLLLLQTSINENMATDYKTYLAANVLNDDKTVGIISGLFSTFLLSCIQVHYRLLSRAMKVHVNVAKEMLFEFHRQQNAKKAGSIHATYILAGNKRRIEPIAIGNGTTKDGDDAYMQSSPFQSSPVAAVPEETIEDTPVLSVTLVREEDIEGTCLIAIQWKLLTSHRITIPI
jgi:hypothetical protein